LYFKNPLGSRFGGEFNAVPCESASEILLAQGRLSADVISRRKYEKERNVGKKVKKKISKKNYSLKGKLNSKGQKKGKKGRVGEILSFHERRKLRYQFQGRIEGGGNGFQTNTYKVCSEDAHNSF
jgi:hypothetical protein